MAISVESYFENLWKGKVPECTLIQGEDPFLERELREALKKLGFEIFREDIKTASPNSSLEDQALSTSLFQPRRVLWIQAKSGPDKWSKEGVRIWGRMQEHCDPQSMILILQVSAVAGGKKGKSKDSDKDAVSFLTPHSTFWLERMNTLRKGFLDKTRLHHLMALDFDLMALDNAVELWSLGGDRWAADSLGWGHRGGVKDLSANTNPSFAWVDAVLDGRESEAVRLGKELLAGSGEFLMLLGLLAKSLKIWAMIEEGRNDPSQPPFLVSKIQKVRKVWSQREGSSSAALRRITEWTANSDLWIKSRPVDDEALLLRISESPRY